MQSLTFNTSVRRESNSGAYFAGMFRVANVEFIPEYRQAESHEFVSMANKIQHVVCMALTLLFTAHDAQSSAEGVLVLIAGAVSQVSNVYKTSSVARLYKQAVISDLRCPIFTIIITDQNQAQMISAFIFISLLICLLTLTTSLHPSDTPCL